MSLICDTPDTLCIIFSEVNTYAVREHREAVQAVTCVFVFVLFFVIKGDTTVSQKKVVHHTLRNIFAQG